MPKIIITGDLFPTITNTEQFIAGDINSIFGEKIVQLFKEADYVVCNLEGALCSDEVRPIDKDGPILRAPLESIKGIVDAGVDCVSLANNHTTDYGMEGYTQTCSVLEENNIVFFGAGKNCNAIVTHHIELIGKYRVGFYGVSETIFNIPGDNSPGANLYDDYRTCREIEELKKNCDYVFVLYHGGVEHFEYPIPMIRTRFHRMADSGADVILAQHTHCIAEEEYYHNSYLLYGQGNFCLNYLPESNQWNLYGLMLEIGISEGGLDIHKIVVKRTAIGTSYDPEQNMKAFTERTKRLSENGNFEQEFSAFANERVWTYLQAFRGGNLLDRLVLVVFGKKTYRKYLLKHYNKKQLLKILNALRAEEFRSITIQGVQNIIEKM